MRHRADLIVIGAGLHGVSAAMFCAMRGLSVIVLEKDSVARHASGVNAGGVRRLGRHLAEVEISCRSMEIWHRIGDLLDDDCGFQPVPQIKLCESQEDIVLLTARARDLRDRGFTHETMIDQQQLREALPAVADHCVGALMSQDGFAQPFQTVTAFARKARALGVLIVERCPVTDLSRATDHWSISAGGRMFTAEKVLNCAGGWAGRIAAQIGDFAPVEPIAPMMIVTQRMPRFCDAVVGTARRPLSFKQMPNGTVVIGGARLGRADPDTNRTDIEFSELRHTAETAISVFPIMRHAVIQRAWSGIEGRMPDGIPVIGRSPAQASAFHAFGFSAHGFQLGPGVGEIMAELIATERTNAPLSHFAIDRFAN